VLAEADNILGVNKQVGPLARANQVVDNLRQVATTYAPVQALADDVIPLGPFAEAGPRLAVVHAADTIVPVAQRVGLTALGCSGVAFYVLGAVARTLDTWLAAVRARNRRAKHLNPTFACRAFVLHVACFVVPRIHKRRAGFAAAQARARW